jgi:RNA polymerase sigma-70 factor, ECF subfamily
MSSEHQAIPLSETVPVAVIAASASPRDRRPTPPLLSDDTRIAIEIRELVGHGSMEVARHRFAELVSIHQRRALRIAYQYLRQPDEADEAVQDAFLKAFGHIDSYREAWPFEVWFTRILINGCLDRRKARMRRARWFVGTEIGQCAEDAEPAFGGTVALDPEARLLGRERRARIAAAIDQLDGRQRLAFMLSHYGDHTPREVGAMMGLKESTVRVHLFRAARKLRGLLGGRP